MPLKFRTDIVGVLICSPGGSPEVCVMKIVLNMVRKSLKQGEAIFETSEKSDELYLIQSGKVDIIDASTMRRKLGDADPVLRALIRNLTNRLADANLMNEEQWQRLKIHRSLSPEGIQKP